jgi:hypothetical protein
MATPAPVRDWGSNRNENIEHAARAVGRGKARQKVFQYIYKSKARLKPVSEIMRATGMNRVRVLQEADRLFRDHVVEKGKVKGETAYKKDVTYSQYKERILKQARNPKLGEKHPTKQRPHVSGGTGGTVVVKVRPSGGAPREITVDDVESFKLVRKVKAIDPGLRLNKVREEVIKTGLKRIIGEGNDFRDWGGEKNDLFTNKFKRSSSRTTAALALKGRATQGTLTPKKMGKNGDQVLRLAGSSAEVLFVVYHSKVDESVHEQLRLAALGRSMAGRKIYYGVIDGDDLNRLYQAYPDKFK